ncbi:MAG TPA: hypothetical protein DEO71_02320 [Chryseobacterium sp.]|nr:hypothetical protein [Chryseobacterium sp.]
MIKIIQFIFFDFLSCKFPHLKGEKILHLLKKRFICQEIGREKLFQSKDQLQCKMYLFLRKLLKMNDYQ